MADGQATFTNDTIVLFIHGAMAPALCDFDLSFQDDSWADWMVERDFAVYMFDKRNYGGSTREKAMDEPAAEKEQSTATHSGYPLEEDAQGGVGVRVLNIDGVPEPYAVVGPAQPEAMQAFGDAEATEFAGQLTTSTSRRSGAPQRGRFLNARYTSARRVPVRRFADSADLTRRPETFSGAGIAVKARSCSLR
jgi:hypothetical protein